jgi:glycine oxidase
LGVRFYIHEEAVALQHHGAIVDEVCTVHGKCISCQHLVLATGAWAAQCAKWLDFILPVRPLRGQSITLQQPASPIHHMIFGAGGYLAPKHNKMIIKGLQEMKLDLMCRQHPVASRNSV